LGAGDLHPDPLPEKDLGGLEAAYLILRGEIPKPLSANVANLSGFGKGQ
jgi:hypothetical protein